MVLCCNGVLYVEMNGGYSWVVGSDADARIIKLIFSKPLLTDKIHRTVMYYLRALSLCA